MIHTFDSQEFSDVTEDGYFFLNMWFAGIAFEEVLCVFTILT